jgi:hypothetical protein
MKTKCRVLLLTVMLFALRGIASTQPVSRPSLSCSPAPCLLPNVQASQGKQPVDTAAIAVNPAEHNQLAIAANDYNCGTYIGLLSSSDGGSTWAHACMPSQGGNVGLGNPSIAYDAGGTLYATAQENQDIGSNVGSVAISTSFDNGMTWGTPVNVISHVLGYAAQGGWVGVDTSPNSPFKNTIYVSSNQTGNNGNSQTWISHSRDGGLTWTSIAVDTVQFIPQLDVSFAPLVLGPDGTVYMAWQRCSEMGSHHTDCAGAVASILLSKSTDGGNTWSSPVTVAQPLLAPNPNGCCFFGQLPNTIEEIYDTPMITVSGSGTAAKVYVAFYNFNNSQMQVEVATSIDGGNTFGAPVRVSGSNSGDQFFPAISVTNKVVVTWLDRRNDPNNIKYQPFVATSGDGGLTFSTGHALSTTLSDPNNDGFSGFFMGYYRAQVPVGRAFYANWMDTRTGKAQVELGGVQF